MDLLEEIKIKIGTIYEYKDIEGLNSVLVHIEHAEMLFYKGKEENDDHLFTDVIYRTNQAFEGILKEAYIILAERRSASRKSPHKIEEYLIRNKIFNKRVSGLFRNYRQDWRNPSTHDYNLFFSESEAFLAIISVSSFIHVLLDQIIERLSFEREKAYFAESVEDIKDKIERYEEISLFEKIQEILLNFDYSKFKNKKKGFFTEVELLGAIHAYFNQIDSKINVNRETAIRLRSKIGLPDFIIEKDGQQIIVEVKNSLNRNTLNSGISQLKMYLNQSDLNEGILFALSAPNNLKRSNKVFCETTDDYKLAVIIPKSLI